jgi:hypothetical protein
MNIYKQQKFTFKLTIEFSFFLVSVDDENFDTKNSIDTNKITPIRKNSDISSNNENNT